MDPLVLLPRLWTTGASQREVGDFSRKANEYGIDLWVIDHLLHAPGLYGMPWLEPMMVLTHAAAVAPDVMLGTGILVLPLRNPVLLAKEIATLDFLSGGRFLFGVGPGWYRAEFSSTGTNVKERGARTDEILEAVRLLLTQDDVTYEGRHYQFQNVTIEPRPPKMPEVWVAGGRACPIPSSATCRCSRRPCCSASSRPTRGSRAAPATRSG